MSRQKEFLIKYDVAREQILHLNSKNIPINPNCLYELKIPIEGIKGKRDCVFFAILFFDENKKEISRKIRQISNFSGKQIMHSIISESPPKSKFAKIAIRINSENKAAKPTHVIIKLSDLNNCILSTVKNKSESYDNMTDYERYWKEFDKKRYRQLVLPTTKKDFRSLGSYYKEKFKEFNINYFEGKRFSQNGEDGILEFIFSMVGKTNKFFIEFGVGNGNECNTRNLLTTGWIGLMMDAQDNINPLIKKEFVTAENVNKIFSKYKVPKNFDLLSIDVDYNDYWIWKAIKEYFPRVIVIEYNSTIPPNESKVVKYNKNAVWDQTNYFGASLKAFYKLGKSKGYTLVGCDNHGVNAFFIKDEIVQGKIKEKNIKDMFRSPKFGKIVDGKCLGHGPSKKKMIDI